MANHFKISFEKLNESHFPLMHKWFNKKHVQEFYSLRDWGLKEVEEKLLPYTEGKQPIHGYVIYDSHIPFGYIQSYSIREFPWEDQELRADIILHAAGIDLFIGEEEYLQKNLGAQLIEIFLEKFIWPKYQYCLADPDIRNKASLRLFEKCGFTKHKQIDSKSAINETVRLQLFIRKRNDT